MNTASCTPATYHDCVADRLLARRLPLLLNLAGSCGDARSEQRTIRSERAPQMKNDFTLEETGPPVESRHPATRPGTTTRQAA